MKLNSLKAKIWGYLIIFSASILFFLWLFQIIFLNKFYEYSKIEDINKTKNNIKKYYENNMLYDNLDTLAKDNGICIQVYTDSSVIFDSQSFNRGCMPPNLGYKDLFIDSLELEETYEVVNPRFNNKVLIKAIKLNTNTFVFLSSSLEPLDNAIEILKNQFIIVTIIVLLLSLIVGYYISKKISNPIVKINKEAIKMKNGDYENTYFYVKENIDELNELAKTLNNTIIELNKAEILSHELMANVGHDLKTPLTMIKAYAEMVRDLTYKDDVKREDNLNVIIEESNRLSLLVDDIVLLSKEKANIEKLNNEKFDIVSLIKKVVNRFEIMEINVEIISPEKAIVNADIKRIEQVLYNLIINAINHVGKDKKVIIKVAENESNYLIEVIDHGKGIKKEDIKFIFKRYYKVDKKYRRDKKGSGIGLSIVESILKRHGFKYGVKSKVSEGTTFYFEVSK